MIAFSAAVAAVLVAVHLFSGRIRFLNVEPRSRWLSFAGGVSVAYVFVHILPDLAHSQAALAEFARNIGFLEHHVYLVALAGLIVFYGLERAVKSARRAGAEPADEGTGVFWLHIGSFGLYNALIGYLLTHREDPSARGLALFGTAMALHFVVNDYGLRRDHKEAYRRVGRWVLAAAAAAGWVVGVLTEIHPAAVAALFGFLAGGVVLNVLKEELPEERASNFWAFLAGSAGYAALLVAVG